MTTGVVDSKGRSALPEHLRAAGVHDTAEGAENLHLDAEIEERLKTLTDELLGHDIQAEYKLEFMFNEQRSVHKPFYGLVVAWTNGGFAHGGGDEAVYFCPKEIERDGLKKFCSHRIELKFVGKNVAVCPGCSSAIEPKELAGQIGYRLSAQGWVEVMVRAFTRLDCKADIRIGYFPENIIKATQLELEKDRGGEVLNQQVRRKRQWVRYPLRNILKDTASGRSVRSCFRSFLLA